MRFEVVDPADLARRMGLAQQDQLALFDDVPTSLAIWTTTPWTLPANQAVAVHPQFDYSLVGVRPRRRAGTGWCWPPNSSRR